MWSRIESIIWHTAPSRARLCMWMCVCELRKRNEIMFKIAFIQNILWALTDTKTHTHTSIQTHDLADIFRSVFDISDERISYAYICMLKPIQNISKAHDLPGFLASSWLTYIWYYIMCNSVLNGLYRRKKHWCSSHTVICRATQSVRRFLSCVGFLSPINYYEDCGTFENFVEIRIQSADQN